MNNKTWSIFGLIGLIITTLLIGGISLFFITAFIDYLQCNRLPFCEVQFWTSIPSYNVTLNGVIKGTYNASLIRVLMGIVASFLTLLLIGSILAPIVCTVVIVAILGNLIFQRMHRKVEI